MFKFAITLKSRKRKLFNTQLKPVIRYFERNCINIAKYHHQCRHQYTKIFSMCAYNGDEWVQQFRDGVMLRMCCELTLATLFVRFFNRYYVATIPKSRFRVREILEVMRFIGCPEPPPMGSWHFVPPEMSQATGVPCATLQGEPFSFLTWGRNVREFSRFSPLALLDTSCEDWQMSVRASRAAPTSANWSCEVWPSRSEPRVRRGSTKGSTLSMPADW